MSGIISLTNRTPFYVNQDTADTGEFDRETVGLLLVGVVLFQIRVGGDLVVRD